MASSSDLVMGSMSLRFQSKETTGGAGVVTCGVHGVTHVVEVGVCSTPAASR